MKPDLDLCYMGANEALGLFRRRKLSPVELMQAVITRAEATREKLNALTFTYFDEAMEAARKAEKKYAKGHKTGALEGLPIAIKDESYIAGLPTSNGSLTMKGFIAPENSANNERILKAGGIVHARTATPEFSCASYTWTKLWGVTRNPWNTEFTPGGSSGGSGSALAAGMTTLAMGSDIGGSIRIPASATGVVGYKPPYGRNPDDPPFNLDFYCHTGPMARSVQDTILLQNVISGPHPHDIVSLRPKLDLPMKYKPINKWKIGFSMDLGMFEVDPEVQRNTGKALDVFRSLGSTVEEIDIGWGPEVLEGAMRYLEHLFGASLSRLLAEQADELCSYTRKFAEDGKASKSTDFVETLEIAGRAYRTLGPLLEKYDVIICPTTALPAVPADFDSTVGKVVINGKEVHPMLGWVMTTPFNMMSRCPVLSVPSGFARNGVPTGIQIIGKTYRDEDVMRAAIAYERAVGGWYGSKKARPRL